MTVDSYLELFTTLFGWRFYDILWDVLVGTGIVFLPFLGILIDNWREPAEGGEFGTVTGLSLRRMETGTLHRLAGGRPGRATGRTDTAQRGYPQLHATTDVDRSYTNHGNRGSVPKHLWLHRVYRLTGDREHSGVVVCRAVDDLRIQSCGG